MIAVASFQSGPSSVQEFVGVVLIVVIAVIVGLTSKNILIGLIAGCMAGALVEMALFLIYGVIVGGELHVMTATAAGGMLGSLSGGLGRWWKRRAGSERSG
jgi:hypothetical protein